MGYRETIAYLYGLQKHGIKLGLENPRKLLARLGNPQGSFRSVHVAGTNGKGSTAAALASVLRQTGPRTGLFTSPHLISFTERIKVDDAEITEGEVISLAEEIRACAEGLNPTFFEVVTAMGFLHFKRKGVQWAVVETGMGGRLDATNVIEPEACVITSIGLDHREFLGDDIRAVAGEKAGIIKEGIPVVTVSHEPGVMEVVERAARLRNAPLHVAGRDFTFEIKGHGPFRTDFDYRSGGLGLEGLVLPLSGPYQALNASLAVRAFELLGVDCPSPGEAVREGLRALRWPGRLELAAKDPPIVIDGAHNPSAAAALALALREDFLGGGERMVLVMGIMSDKDLKGLMAPLLPLAREVIFAAPGYARAAPPALLARCAEELGYGAKTAASVREAIEMARAFGGLVVVTGSFYTIGEAKEVLGSAGTLTGLRE
jgi:dihydrofolate synthase/folylpolyglutamate synthase